MKTLIVYASKYGTTEECAEYLGKALGKDVSFCNLAKDGFPDLSSYDCIVIGGGIYAGRIHKKVRSFCQASGPKLLDKRLGLFICDMEEGEASKKQLENNYPQELVSHATVADSFGGQFLFSRMGFFVRTLIKLMSKSNEDVKRIQYDVIKDFAKALQA
jgi:menaquinone-dependent protoporphyrinogen oxidase